MTELQGVSGVYPVILSQGICALFAKQLGKGTQLRDSEQEGEARGEEGKENGVSAPNPKVNSGPSCQHAFPDRLP
jgi:hypothetical protein